MKDLKTLRKYALKPFFKGNFLTKDEFEENMGEIFIIIRALRNLETKIKENEISKV